MPSSVRDHESPFHAEWSAAVACFALAALTGTLFRLSAAGFAPLSGVDLGFVRNAHSHLMLFSWATPLLMALIARGLVGQMGAKAERIAQIARFRRAIRLALVLGLLSFVPFLLAGYGAMRLGSVKLPLSILFSTLSMLVWYAFAVLYASARRFVVAGPAERLWDLAVVFLVVGSAGAWARGALMAAGVNDPLWANGTIQFFLVTFSFGWLLLGVLGEFHRRCGTEKSRGLVCAFWLLALGVPVVFTSAIPANVPPWLDMLGHLGSLFVAVGLGIHLQSLWRATGRSAPRPSLVALALVTAGMLGASMPPVWEWADSMGLRIVFVHVILLGVVSLGLVEAHAPQFARAGKSPMPASVVVLLATMLPTTGLWPGLFGPAADLYLVAAGSLAPAVAALWLLARSPRW